VALHWPALVVGATCVGLALSIWVAIPFAAVLLLAVTACAGVLLTSGGVRVAALAAALAVLGLAWGSLRMDALRASVLAHDMGATGVAELVTVAPARSSPWSTRVIAVTRTFRHEAVRERVLLVLPVGRSPPGEPSSRHPSGSRRRDRKRTASTSERGSRARASTSSSMRRAGVRSGDAVESPASATSSGIGSNAL